MHTHNTNHIDVNITEEELKPLYKTKPLIHISAIIFNWILIAATIILTLKLESIAFYFLAVIIIGARMHALAILMHDASHFRFLRNKFWNDMVTNVTIMYPIFTSIEVYRNNHLKHHRHLNTDHDPDWVAKLGNRHFTFPKTRSEFLLTLFSYFILYQGFMDALWFLRRFGGVKQAGKVSQNRKIIKGTFYLLLFAALTFFGAWKAYLLLWVVPYFSTFFMYQYIRSVAEHFGDLAYEDDLSSSRTTKANFIEKFFIAPHNVGYHLEHHLYPGVPYYNLPKLHAILMANPSYEANAHVTEGYTSGLLRELSTNKSVLA